MDIPNKFLCILVRGNVTQDEKEYIRDIYNKNGKENICELIKVNKIVPFAARTFCECDIDSSEWQSVLNNYRNRNKKIILYKRIS